MTDSSIRKALGDAVTQILESMFFVDAPVECPECSQSITDFLTARLSFDGDPPGNLTLRVTSASARQIAADFLGIDEAEISSTQTEEVVCELANMICGCLLSRVESTATFNLSAPRIVPAEDAEDAAAVSYTAKLQDGVLTVRVAIEAPICLQPNQSAF